MSKYIDAEWLENNSKVYSLGYYDDDEYAIPFEALGSAPSIDIVRCGECKYYRMNEYSEVFHCYRGLCEVTPTDFCSYGERSSE